ncbi:MAG: ornithine cyclodeaminase family protein [Pseudomonadota bacterium]
MQVHDKSAVAAALDYPSLIDALAVAFASVTTSPVRTRHDIERADGETGTLLLMPAWQAEGEIGIKLVTVFPANARRGLGAVQASYVLLDGDTGVPQAFLDGDELTLRRTGAASALAARYLARENARTLLMIGAGHLAPHLIRAHAAVRPYTRIMIWARRSEAAEAVARSVADVAEQVTPVPDIEAAVRDADVLSAATLSEEPLIRGDWLRPGQHVDLVGAFTPAMREADVDVMRRGRVFVDTRDGALAEAGDLLQAIDAGAMQATDVVGELAELARGDLPGRRQDDDITVFKSVGSALEDLCAAQLVVGSGP